jgi:hypothetical protein
MIKDGAKIYQTNECFSPFLAGQTTPAWIFVKPQSLEKSEIFQNTQNVKFIKFNEN